VIKMPEMREKRMNINMLVIWIIFIAFILLMIFLIPSILKRLTGQ